MKNQIKKTVATLVGFVALCAVSLHSMAGTPHQAVETSTNNVISIVKASKSTFKSNPSAFYQKLDKELSKLVDFKSFSDSVMGKYGNASKGSAADKKKLNQQKDRFAREFKTRLLTRYGSALLAFNGEKLQVVPPTASDKAKIAAGQTVIVKQYMISGSKKYAANYTMKRNSRGAWKVRNITLEGVNVGKVYRQQFYSYMKKYGNNVDKVIDNWSVVPNLK